MKSQTQIMTIALAIAFAIALAMTVALICVTYFQDEVPPTDKIDKTTSAATTVNKNPEHTTSTTSSESHSQESPHPELPDVSNGLSFTSLGDGTCKVSGIGTCRDACVVIPSFSPAGDRVVEIGTGAFFECSTITAIQIPASVHRIGELAFAACDQLIYISVSQSNPVYCDREGVLYSADLSTLIFYPPLRAGSSLTIDASTTVIKEMAFYGCVYLRNIHYTGSAEQWDRILIGSKNYSLTAAAKTFEGSGE